LRLPYAILIIKKTRERHDFRPPLKVVMADKFTARNDRPSEVVDPFVHVRLGQKQTFAVQKGMSASPPKADICAASTCVRFGPFHCAVLECRAQQLSLR